MKYTVKPQNPRDVQLPPLTETQMDAVAAYPIFKGFDEIVFSVGHGSDGPGWTASAGTATNGVMTFFRVDDRGAVVTHAGLIGKGTPPTLTVPREPYQLEFRAYEKLPGSDPQGEIYELDELRKRCQMLININFFRGETTDQNRDCTKSLLTRHCGYTVLPVLPELIGLPLNDLVYAYLLALRPSAIRVLQHNDAMHLDAQTWRVTVRLDEKDVVTKIEQEVQVGFGTGYDMGNLLREFKGGRKAEPAPAVIGNTAALARVQFD